MSSDLPCLPHHEAFLQRVDTRPMRDAVLFIGLQAAGVGNIGVWSVGSSFLPFSPKSIHFLIVGQVSCWGIAVSFAGWPGAVKIAGRRHPNCTLKNSV